MTRFGLLTCTLTLSLASTGLFAQMDMSSIMQQMGKGGAMEGMKIEEDTDPFVPNTFLGSFAMEMHMYKDGVEDKSSPMNMQFASNAEKTMVHIQHSEMKGDVHMLTDFKAKDQYILMSDEKGTKTALKTKKMKVTLTDEMASKTPDVKVTDEKKTIDGHVCTKVISTSEDGVCTAWLATDIEAPLEDMMRHVKSPESYNLAKRLYGVTGFPLEYEWVDAKEPNRMVYMIKDLKLGAVDKKTFSIADYTVVELPMMPFGK